MKHPDDITLNKRSRVALRYILRCNRSGEHPSLGKISTVLKLAKLNGQAARVVNDLTRAGLVQKFGNARLRGLIVTVRGQERS